MHNATIALLNNHRSIRRFDTQAIDEDTVKTLVHSAQMASSSSFVQAYSIIGVSDADKKQALRQITGQSYVQYNGHLFVFVADFYRHHTFLDADTDILGNSENFIVATIDATLAAQNMVIAAQSLGLGTCYIGALRNNMAEVIEILALPKYTYPLFALVVGYPEQQGSQKMRLPFAEIYHENTYEQTPAAITQRLNDYDRSISAYYAQRGDGKEETWTAQMQRKFSLREREDVDAILQSQGFLQQPKQEDVTNE